MKNIGGKIIIEPFDEKRINPNSYNLSLANELLVYKDTVLDMKLENLTEKIIIPENGLVLEPNKLYLGRTNEYTATTDFVPMLEGRSSTGGWGCSFTLPPVSVMLVSRASGRWRYSVFSL